MADIDGSAATRAATADDSSTLVEGNRAAPIDLTHAARTGHTLPGLVRGRGGSVLLTAMSRVHSADVRSRTSFARQVPAAGVATSANQ